MSTQLEIRTVLKILIQSRVWGLIYQGGPPALTLSHGGARETVIERVFESQSVISIFCNSQQ